LKTDSETSIRRFSFHGWRLRFSPKNLKEK